MAVDENLTDTKTEGELWADMFQKKNTVNKVILTFWVQMRRVKSQNATDSRNHAID